MLDSDTQKQQFHQRIDRIQTRLLEDQAPRKKRRVTRDHTMSQLAVAPSLAELSRASARKRRGFPFAGHLAFLVGIAVMLAANVIVFRTSGATTNAVAEFLSLIGPLPLAGALSILLIFGCGMRRRPQIIGLTLGLVLMYFVEPYVAYALPEVWAKLYTAEHFDAMMVESGLRVAGSHSL
ncbi:hypothetical protein [Albibacillus kandeliae]|uniref:hypothetical protein n=1 Tax=Albibacillus kandeliae TaxID=2174228 RepID=UPI000D68F1EB|nr:hypothetical protein [Albibacillus kandeliae]